MLGVDSCFYRALFLSLGFSTVSTNRDWDVLIGWDQLLELVKIIHHVKTRNFFSRPRFLSRLFESYWNILTLSRLFEELQVQKSPQIEKNDKINSLLIQINTNCWDWPKISCLNGFLNLDQDFWDWKVV